MIDLTGEVPPHDADAERAVISCCLMDPQAAWLALEAVRPEHFHLTFAREAFVAIAALAPQSEPWDAVALRGRLLETGKAGAAEWLLDVATDPTDPTPSHVRAYARRVRAKARLRALGMAAMRLGRAAYDGGPDAETEAAKHAAAILRVLEDRAKTTHATMQELALAEAHRLEEGPVAESVGLQTGLVDLDAVLGGMRRQELLILAARPSMGKTALACAIMRNVVLAIPPTRVLFFSLEMSRTRIARNMIAQIAEVDASALDAARLNHDETRKAIGAAQALYERAPMIVDDGAGTDLMAIRSRAQATEGVGLVVVDYLQLVAEPADGRNDTLAARTGRVAEGLKKLAKTLDVPVLALAQLNRGVESREGHKPRMSDLKESGKIEEAADVILLLHREEYYNRKDESLRGKATVQIEKNRNGRVGEVPLTFNARCVRFDNAATRGTHG